MSTKKELEAECARLREENERLKRDIGIAYEAVLGAWHSGECYEGGAYRSGSCTCGLTRAQRVLRSALDGKAGTEYLQLVQQLTLAYAGLRAVEGLISDSLGVAGLHANGEVALWDELRRYGRYQEHLLAFDVAFDALPKQPQVPRVPDGMAGVRDVDCPCSSFAPGMPAGAMCLGDGHYLCNECMLMIPRSNEGE